jgi:thiol-disulfide isomerase/thioredoxin
MTDDQRIRLALAWHALNPPGPKDKFDPNDLVQFDDYREVAPGVWLPFHETRTCCYGSDAVKGKWQVDRAELRVVSIRTDRDLADACARLMPKEGDPVQDQRFAVAVDFKYKADRTDDEVRRAADAEYQKRLKDQELVKRLLEPIAALAGKPAPVLPADGWVGGKRPDVAGKPYLVRFWAEWCGPCKGDLPLLKRLAEQGVIVVGMHPPGTPAETVAAAVRERKSSWPTFVAQGKSGGGGPVDIGGYRVGAFPYYVLVDAKGRVAGHGFLPALLKQFGAAAMIPPTKTPSPPK